MGNKTSILNSSKVGECFNIDIVYSTDYNIPMKRNKWLIIGTDKMIFKGINNIYKSISYDKIKGWTFYDNQDQDKIKFVFTDDNEIKISCSKIKELIKTFKNEIIITMINSQYPLNKINKACKDLKLTEFYL